ncbi:MAG TPA: glycosyltransferase family 2 protein [Stellaceae bacterium]|nr:glycosyltransferase family 2 protein [Stellaceae bacterium]
MSSEPIAPLLPSRERAQLSVIVPAKNEEQNLPELVRRLFAVLHSLNRSFEVIVVNDGSTDGSLRILRAFAAFRPELRVIDLARNYGQTAAMMAGLDHARGDIIVPIDADLQNDPADIPLLLAKLDEGYDVVSGWRKNRQDAAIRRNFVSRVGNRIISWLSGVRLHDYGCSLKVYRREVISAVRLYGEMHRFVPIYASWYGARITEIPVTHSPRLHGKSNYGLERVLKVVLDLMVVRFLDRWLGKPIYIFGGFGLACFIVASLSTAYMLYLKFFGHLSMIQTPLPLLVVMSVMMGAMSICIGLVAEIVVRTYFESQGKTIYHARELINLDGSSSHQRGG